MVERRQTDGGMREKWKAEKGFKRENNQRKLKETTVRKRTSKKRNLFL